MDRRPHRSPAANAEVERQLAGRCAQQENGCEIRAGGQEYLALAMNRDWVTPGYQLLRLASIDDAMRGSRRDCDESFF